MSDWALLIIEGSAHLVNLESKITEIKDFGSFPTEILQGHESNIEFELAYNKATEHLTSGEVFQHLIKIQSAK